MSALSWAAVPTPGPTTSCREQADTGRGPTTSQPLLVLPRMVLALGFSSLIPRGGNPELATELSRRRQACCQGGGADGLGEGTSQGDRSIRQSTFPKLPGWGSPVCCRPPGSPVRPHTEGVWRKGEWEPGLAHQQRNPAVFSHHGNSSQNKPLLGNTALAVEQTNEDGHGQAPRPTVAATIGLPVTVHKGSALPGPQAWCSALDLYTETPRSSSLLLDHARLAVEGQKTSRALGKSHSQAIP